MPRSQRAQARLLTAVACAGAIAALAIATMSRVAPTSRQDVSLRWLWVTYQRGYLHDEGYVTDPLRDGQVTSEAQSYAMLQAAWLGDRRAFDRIWHWTYAHLRRPDGLHSWLWNPRTGAVVDANTATDADVDIAFALIIAASRFDDRSHLEDAGTIVRAIRQQAGFPVGQRWFPSAGNWAVAPRIANLSYFAPYAYEHFDVLDPGSGWHDAIDLGYDLLDDATDGGATRLPADFTRVSPTGHLEALPAESTLSRDFSFDSVRILWRVDFDCQLFARARACRRHPLLDHLEAIRRRDGRFVTAYDVNGAPRAAVESMSFYAAFLPSYRRHEPGVALTWQRSVMSPSAVVRLSHAKTRYYDANWIWFGLAQAGGRLAAWTPKPVRDHD